MKKHFVWLLLLFPLLLTGCYGEEDKEKDQGDYIWDFINYNIYFSVKDAAGNNLLDPQVASNILGNEITVEYGDKSFHWKILWIPALICPAVGIEKRSAG